MKIISRNVAIAMTLIGLATPGFADSTGKYENLLIDALLANAAGECPVELMGERVKTSCDSQLPDLQAIHLRLGHIKAVSFLGTGPLEGGPAEVYKVTFEHGDWTWTLNTQSDRRMFLAFAPKPHWDIGSYSGKSASKLADERP